MSRSRIRASAVKIGDILDGMFQIAEISHGPLDSQIRFRSDDGTATSFRFDDEFVTVDRQGRA